jgi:hypothetical protein
VSLRKPVRVKAHMVRIQSVSSSPAELALRVREEGVLQVEHASAAAVLELDDGPARSFVGNLPGRDHRIAQEHVLPDVVVERLAVRCMPS